MGRYKRCRMGAGGRKGLAVLPARAEPKGGSITRGYGRRGDGTGMICQTRDIEGNAHKQKTPRRTFFVGTGELVD